MANASSDAEDRKSWPLPIEKHFIDVLVEEQLKGNMPPDQVRWKFQRLKVRNRVFSELIGHSRMGWDSHTNIVIGSEEPNPKCKEFWKKGLDHCDLLGQLFNKSTANGFLQISFAQSAPNSDEERELDEGFLSAGVHVYLETDSGDDIDKLTTLIEEQSRCTEKHVAQPEHSKGKKKKGEIRSEMNEAIKGFMEVSKVRLIANESRKQTGESFVGGDRFSIYKAVEVLNSYDHLYDFTRYKVLKELLNPNVRAAFISMKPERRNAWMELVGNGY
nr:L10-interacting MYB domain-containing protein-like isoform X2 [Quercus suber]